MRYRNWNEKGERKFRLSVLALLILVLGLNGLSSLISKKIGGKA